MSGTQKEAEQPGTSNRPRNVLGPGWQRSTTEPLPTSPSPKVEKDDDVEIIAVQPKNDKEPTAQKSRAPQEDSGSHRNTSPPPTRQSAVQSVAKPSPGHRQLATIQSTIVSPNARNNAKRPLQTEQPTQQPNNRKKPRIQEPQKPILATNKIVFRSKKARDASEKSRALQEERVERRRHEDLQRSYRAFSSSGASVTHRSRFDRMHTSRRDDSSRGRNNAQDSLQPHKKQPSASTAAASTATTAVDTPAVASDSFLAKLELLSTDNINTTNHNQTNHRELEQIREHYLGIKKEKRKIQKPSEKFRNIFNFEWDATEDTARGDNNPLYQNRVEPQLLFGRGFRAGVDIREQRKHNNFYDELVKRRVAKGVIEDEPHSLVPKDKSQLLRQRDIESNDPNRVHWSEKELSDMTERDWRIFREDFEIYIRGGRVPAPMRTWGESELDWELLEAVKTVGYTKPTPIQMQAIPIALEQRDLIGIAETGSGKTAAFVLPLLTYVNKLPALNDETSQDGPYCLVLAPSRELALQIEEETKKFSFFCRCRAVGVVGGRNAESQAFELRKGAEVVIGTPGRIKDCLEKSYTVLNQCNYLVLDEADRMIDLGFEEIVNWILDKIPMSNLKSEDEVVAFRQELEAKAGHRQYRLTHMFSATMPPALERLARKYLRAPAYISIGDPGAGKRSIEQRLEFMPEGKKKQRLHETLQTADTPCMVFTNQKKVADVLAKQLQKMGFRSASLHGGKAQETREASLQGFRDGEFDILVATDVAGRGIDVEGVQTVINFDMPKEIEPYTHRIGRTGRMGKKGLAISFVTEEDSAIFYDLKNLLISTNNIVPFELLNHPAAKTKAGTMGTKGKDKAAAQLG